MSERPAEYEACPLAEAVERANEALDWIERLKPKRAILTNLHTDLDYATLAAELPPHVTPAYDGMRVDIAV